MNMYTDLRMFEQAKVRERYHISHIQRAKTNYYRLQYYMRLSHELQKITVSGFKKWTIAN